VPAGRSTNATAARSGLAQETVPHLLTKRRQDLVAVRTQTINRLHRLLLDLVPGGARRNLTAKRAAALLDQVAPTGAPAVTRWQLAGELVADVRQLEQRITAVEACIKTAVARSRTSRLPLPAGRSAPPACPATTTP
jgi:transposase